MTSERSARHSALTAEPASAVPIGDVEPQAQTRLPVGIAELDRVLGGGLVPGSGTLIAGEPGIGKSTLLLMSAQALSLAGHRFLYLCGEESTAQVKLRADRLGPSGGELFLLTENELARIEQQIEQVAPTVVGLDSIQTVRAHEIPSAPGSVIQLREAATRLLNLARARGFCLVVIGHVTKDGSIAGPRSLEHLVDATLSFEGDRTQALRVLRTQKNRFGSTQEVGLFEMSSAGLREVRDASEFLLGARRGDCVGAATAAIIEGRRPLLVEVQALVSPSGYGSAARKVSGLDGGRLSLLAAVFEKRLGLPLSDHDIYANVVGGVRVQNAASDLALAAALLSSVRDRPLPATRVFSGEVGLLGEVRPVPDLSHRLEEAARLGFTSACVAAGSRVKPPAGLTVWEISDLEELADGI